MYFQVGAGLVLLFMGGEMLVLGSVSLARRLGVSALLIGLSVVGFGTSAPELVVSVNASLRGFPDIAVGNVVGSNIANILFILGVSALIFPIACKRQSVYRDGLTLLVITALFVAAGWVGTFYRWEGAVMVAMLALYIVHCYRDERIRGPADPAADLHIREAEEIHVLPGGVAVSLLFAAAGIVALVAGANQLVQGGVALARAVGVSDAVIGVTLVAVGTSLPELATSTVAAIRRHSDVALGNVIGSNMFNLLGVLGAAAMARPVTVAEKFLRLDMWVMLAVTVLLLALMRKGWHLSRRDAALFLVAYAAYVVIQFTGGPGLDPAPGAMP